MLRTSCRLLGLVLLLVGAFCLGSVGSLQREVYSSNRGSTVIWAGTATAQMYMTIGSSVLYLIGAGVLFCSRYVGRKKPSDQARARR